MEWPQWKGNRKKYNIQRKIKILLRRACELEKIIKFPKQIEMFEEI